MQQVELRRRRLVGGAGGSCCLMATLNEPKEMPSVADVASDDHWSFLPSWSLPQNVYHSSALHEVIISPCHGVKNV